MTARPIWVIATAILLAGCESIPGVNTGPDTEKLEANLEKLQKAVEAKEVEKVEKILKERRLPYNTEKYEKVAQEAEILLSEHYLQEYLNQKIGTPNVDYFNDYCRQRLPGVLGYRCTTETQETVRQKQEQASQESQRRVNKNEQRQEREDQHGRREKDQDSQISSRQAMRCSTLEAHAERVAMQYYQGIPRENALKVADGPAQERIVKLGYENLPQLYRADARAGAARAFKTEVFRACMKEARQ